MASVRFGIKYHTIVIPELLQYYTNIAVNQLMKDYGSMNMTRETIIQLISQEATFHDIPVPDERWARRYIRNNFDLQCFERSLNGMDV